MALIVVYLDLKIEVNFSSKILEEAYIMYQWEWFRQKIYKLTLKNLTICTQLLPIFS